MNGNYEAVFCTGDNEKCDFAGFYRTFVWTVKMLTEIVI